jgi:hypothetical protein
MREAALIGAAGFPGSGKTYANKMRVKIEVTKANPRKVLVIDSQDEYGQYDPDIMKIGVYVKPIHVSQVTNFSASNFIEACRIRPYNDYGQPLSLDELSNVLHIVMKDFRGRGMLVVEDFKQFAGNSISMELINKLCTRRHSGIDTLVSLQGVGQFTPIMWQNMGYLRLHKCSDSVTKHESKFPEKIAYLTIAENMIDKRFFEGDERFSVMIDTKRGFIFGKYSQKEFIDAARQYIHNNYSQTVGKIKNERDERGKIKYNDAQAIQLYLYRLTQLYSQFSRRAPKNV